VTKVSSINILTKRSSAWFAVAGALWTVHGRSRTVFLAKGLDLPSRHSVSSNAKNPQSAE